MTWEPTGDPLQDFKFLGDLASEEVLYEFDGPRIFTARGARGSHLLAYVCDESADGQRLLVVPTSAEIVRGLEEGVLAVAEAFDQAWLWLVCLTPNGDPQRVYPTKLAEIPRRHRPRPGVRLVHDALVFRVRLIGEGLEPKSVPGSVVRRAVETATSGLKTLYDFVLEATPGGRPSEQIRRLYDLPVQQLGFASFEISFGRPVPPKQIEIDDESTKLEEEATEKVKSLLQTALQWVGRSSPDLPAEDVSESLALLRALDRFTPPQTGVVERVEVSGLLVGGGPPVKLSREASRRVRRTMARLTATEEELITLDGVIDEFDKGNLTFTLRRVSNARPDQKCAIDETLFDDAMEHFVDDTGVTVVGRRVRGSSGPLKVVALQPTTPPKPES